MHITYKTHGTCSSKIEFDLSEDKKVSAIQFTGGCNGNLKAIGKLCEGLPAQEIISKLRGNTCGYKNTSCADQLAIALEQSLK